MGLQTLCFRYTDYSIFINLHYRLAKKYQNLKFIYPSQLTNWIFTIIWIFLRLYLHLKLAHHMRKTSKRNIYAKFKLNMFFFQLSKETLIFLFTSNIRTPCVSECSPSIPWQRSLQNHFSYRFSKIAMGI